MKEHMVCVSNRYLCFSYDSVFIIARDRSVEGRDMIFKTNSHASIAGNEGSLLWDMCPYVFSVCSAIFLHSVTDMLAIGSQVKEFATERGNPAKCIFLCMRIV